MTDIEVIATQTRGNIRAMRELDTPYHEIIPYIQVMGMYLQARHFQEDVVARFLNDMMQYMLSVNVHRDFDDDLDVPQERHSQCNCMSM